MKPSASKALQVFCCAALLVILWLQYAMYQSNIRRHSADPARGSPAPRTASGPETSDPLPGIRHIIYINMDSRTDRNKTFYESMYSQGITGFVRIGGLLNAAHPKVGCLTSHIKALTYALKHYKGQHIVIFEDDIKFEQDRTETRRRLNAFWQDEEIRGNWNVVMLAANMYRPGTPTGVEGVVRLVDSFSASAYVIHADYVETLLRNKQEAFLLIGKYGLQTRFRNDQYCRPLQARDHWYAFLPPLCKQRRSYSDIEKKIVDYNM